MKNHNDVVKKNKELEPIMITYKYYNKIIFQWLISILVVICALNYFINPYNIFIQHIFKRTLLKPEAKIQERITKIISLKFNTNYIDSIFVGSSRTDYSISPLQYKKLTNKTADNIALGGLSFNEISEDIDIALKIHPEIKNIFIGIDFHLFMPEFEKKDYRSDITKNPNLEPQDFGIALLSLKTTTNSIWSIVKTLIGIKHRMYYSSGEKYIDHDQNIQYNFIESWKEFNGKYSGGSFDKRKIEEFIKYIENLQAQNKNVILYIFPSHVTEFYLIYKNKQWNNYELWKKSLVTSIPVYDFQYPNEFTTDVIRPEMDTYFDASHGTYIIGNKIIEDLVNCPQKECKYARYATSENIDNINQQNTTDMETWIKNNPELVKKINQEVD